MKDVNRDPVRWERSMTQNKDGQYVSFHDYTLLLESHDTLRARVAQLEEAQTVAVPDGYPLSRIAGWLDEAADDIADWGAYASEYFQRKHGLSDVVKDYRQRAAGLRAMLSAAQAQKKEV